MEAGVELTPTIPNNLLVHVFTTYAHSYRIVC